MIKVTITYRDEDTLFGPLEYINFYRWETFIAHIERLIKWNVPFQLESVKGEDDRTGLTRSQCRIIACAADSCSAHQNKTIVIDRERRQDNDDFVAAINKKATK